MSRKRCLTYASTSTLAIILASVFLSTINIAEAGPLADYGDAPDDTTNPGNIFAYPGVVGRFPSMYNTNNGRIGGRRGAFHLTTNMEWLGLTQVSTTTKELDAIIVDLDFEDASPLILHNPSGLPLTAYIKVNISIAPSAPDIHRYMNVLVDLNRDGEWRNEWVVKNTPVYIPPGTTVRGYFGPLNLTNPVSPMWTRVTLTRDPIDESIFTNVGGWDGSAPSGGFLCGETEDWKLQPYPWNHIQYGCDPIPDVIHPEVVMVPADGGVDFIVSVHVKGGDKNVTVTIGPTIWSEGTGKNLRLRAQGKPEVVMSRLGQPNVTSNPKFCPNCTWVNFTFHARYPKPADYRLWVCSVSADPEGDVFFSSQTITFVELVAVGGVIVENDFTAYLTPWIIRSMFLAITIATVAAMWRMTKKDSGRQPDPA